MVLVYSSSYRACTVDFVSCQCNYASLSCSDGGTPGGRGELLVTQLYSDSAAVCTNPTVFTLLQRIFSIPRYPLIYCNQGKIPSVTCQRVCHAYGLDISYIQACKSRLHLALNICLKNQ